MKFKIKLKSNVIIVYLYTAQNMANMVIQTSALSKSTFLRSKVITSYWAAP